MLWVFHANVTDLRRDEYEVLAGVHYRPSFYFCLYVGTGAANRRRNHSEQPSGFFECRSQMSCGGKVCGDPPSIIQTTGSRLTASAMRTASQRCPFASTLSRCLGTPVERFKKQGTRRPLLSERGRLLQRGGGDEHLQLLKCIKLEIVVPFPSSGRIVGKFVFRFAPSASR